LYFPEGGVPDDESILLDTFKDGAFRLAIEHQIPIVPISFADNKSDFLILFSAEAPVLCVSKCMIMLILWIKQALIAKKFERMFA
jgi:1-acyl-sn-glycerol-3-phosphate acyltransferase